LSLDFVAALCDGIATLFLAIGEWRMVRGSGGSGGFGSCVVHGTHSKNFMFLMYFVLGIGWESPSRLSETPFHTHPTPSCFVNLKMS
jgi:hypothetical protein